MKSFIDKFNDNSSRFEFFLLIIPFIFWIYCFRYFFTGQLWIEADATSYATHISLYADNLSRGVYPLWDPTWFNGVPNDFFLRRFGDVNPLLFFIVFLKLIGVPSATAYIFFIGGYYFLAAWAVYLITKILLQESFFAFTAYVLFLFSSWGCEVFYNYIIIIFLPIIWFFYFLLSFYRSPRRGSFLGMCFCLSLIVTTYIPFFFLTILIIFAILFILFYGRVFIDFLKKGAFFFSKDKVFISFCLFFLLISCIPALMFYKESKAGQFVLPGRHSGAEESSAVAVGINNAASGDIISHGYFDRLFDDQEHIDMGDIYLPYIFFIFLLTTLAARVNKLIFFLLFNILAFSTITITSAAGVHRFLYDHVLFFKFIRQIYYFFWLAMLPQAILLAVTAFKSLLTTVSSSSKKGIWLAYIIFSHLFFILFLLGHQGVLFGAWSAILLSLFYFVIYFRCESKISYPAGFMIIFLCIFIQSAQVYRCLDNKLFIVQKDTINLEDSLRNRKPFKQEIYYTTRWFDVLNGFLDPVVFTNYLSHPFVLYDNVLPYDDSPEFFKVFEKTMASNENVAYLSRFETSPEDWKINHNAMPQADIDPLHSGKLSLIRSDANTWVLKAHLSNSQFLVLNDNYNSRWHAFINGRPVRLFRANFSFKGVWLPPGESTVVIRFSSPWHYAFHFLLIFFFAATFLYLLVLLKNDSRLQRGQP